MRRRFFQNTNNVSYMFIEALENDFSLSITYVGKLQYCIDNGEYKDVGTSISGVNKGSRIYFVGYLQFSSGWTNRFNATKKCKIGGDVRSIIYGNDFKKYCNIVDGRLRSLFMGSTGIVEVESGLLKGLTELSSNCYGFMFNGCTSLIEAPELPATDLAEHCYANMFGGCTSLVNAPELPATTLANYCYWYMFSGCTSLEVAPELSATTLAQYCYANMFGGCTSLVTAPALPATTLVNSCYSSMFYRCTNLSYIKMLATDISATDCLYGWVNGVSSTGTFVKNKDATWDTTPGALGNSGVPEGWTVVNDGEESGGNDFGIEFPLYLEFDSCETSEYEYICTREPDEISIKLRNYLISIATEYGDYENHAYHVNEQVLNLLGVEVYIDSQKLLSLQYEDNMFLYVQSGYSDGIVFTENGALRYNGLI